MEEIAVKSPVNIKKFFPRRFRPGTVALREVRRYQASTDLLIRKYAIRRLVHTILRKEHPGFSMSRDARRAIHVAAEDHLIKILNVSNKVALEERRLTIIPRDMDVAKYLVKHKINKRKRKFLNKQTAIEEAYKEELPTLPELPEWEWEEGPESLAEEFFRDIPECEDSFSDSVLEENPPEDHEPIIIPDDESDDGDRETPEEAYEWWLENKACQKCRYVSRAAGYGSFCFKCYMELDVDWSNPEDFLTDHAKKAKEAESSSDSDSYSAPSDSSFNEWWEKHKGCQKCKDASKKHAGNVYCEDCIVGMANAAHFMEANTKENKSKSESSESSSEEKEIPKKSTASESLKWPSWYKNQMKLVSSGSEEDDSSLSSG